MTKDEFTEQIEKLARRFHRKGMADEEARDWYQALKDIPSGPWAEICKQWWFGEKFFPTPADLESAWSSWYREHPEKHAAKEYITVDCPDCLRRGHLVAVHLTPDQWDWLNQFPTAQERFVQVKFVNRYVPPSGRTWRTGTGTTSNSFAHPATIGQGPDIRSGGGQIRSARRKCG